jgi:hypothetical protein
MTVATRDKLYYFLEEAGYSENDVLAYNPMTGKVCTKNGGVYEVTESHKIIHYGGPSPDPADRI